MHALSRSLSLSLALSLSLSPALPLTRALSLNTHTHTHTQRFARPKFCAELKLNVAMLPLLASAIGNDYVSVSLLVIFIL